MLKQLKNNGSDFSIKPAALVNNKQGDKKTKTKREEMIDSKIEKLLIAYK